jgi:ssDNA-binding Zn-finger/Zn-ribbon topoisomerase 1
MLVIQTDRRISHKEKEEIDTYNFPDLESVRRARRARRARCARCARRAIVFKKLIDRPIKYIIIHNNTYTHSHTHSFVL